MAEDQLERDIKLTNAEKEKERQNTAGQSLYQSWPVPTNISEMQNYAWGKFTWRDIIFSIVALIIPFILLLPLRIFVPDLVHIIVSVVCGIPLVLLVNKHAFTGDLPIEDKVKIAISDRGESNLLHWDKTKTWDAYEEDGHYVKNSSQSFVPHVRFTADNVAMLPNNEGGFCVIALDVDDMTTAKNTDNLRVVTNFNRMLDALINDTSCVPIQIMLKSAPNNLSSYIDNSMIAIDRISLEGKPVMSLRAEDYTAMLMDMDSATSYHYEYYIVVPYREDSEGVGDDTMNTMSVRREKLKEKSNPFRKRQEAVANMDFEIGADRKKQIKERMKANPFSEQVTVDALEKRCRTIVARLRDIGATSTQVKPRILDAAEISKLFFECYNESDKNTIDGIVAQAMDEHLVLYSTDVYQDFPDVFSIKKSPAMNATQRIQSSGMLSHIGGR